MGKIRVKTIGIEEEEEKQAKLQKKRARQKKLEKKSPVVVEEAKQSRHSGNPPAGGDSRIDSGQTRMTDEQKPKSEKKEMKKKPTAGTTKKSRSQKYQAVASLVDKNRVYSLKEAVELLPKLKIGKFDETVELHINTSETGISGTILLPHGTGKQVKVAIADPSTSSGQVDALIEQISKGVIDFDILIATPAAMPKLARVAKVLGPKGLMPNPKNGTVTANPDEVVKKFQAGQMRYKTEAKNPVLHVSVGKMSFGDKKLSENITMMLKTIGTGKMKKVVLKSTMSPAIKLDFSAVK